MLLKLLFCCRCVGNRGARGVYFISRSPWASLRANARWNTILGSRFLRSGLAMKGSSFLFSGLSLTEIELPIFDGGGRIALVVVFLN